jgi:hypothetical protein
MELKSKKRNATKKQITNCKSQIANRKSQIANRKLKIANRKSQIANRKSQIANRKTQKRNENVFSLKVFFLLRKKIQFPFFSSFLKRPQILKSVVQKRKLIFQTFFFSNVTSTPPFAPPFIGS